MEEKTIQRKQYVLIDVLKFIMASLIIGIHSKSITGESYPMFLSCLMQTAVPFFFVTSGFLFAEHVVLSNATKQSVLQGLYRWMKKILFLYVCWTILYLPLTICGYYQNHLSWRADCLLFVRGFLFLGEHNYSWPLWYLLASLIAACLIYLFVKIRLKTRGWFLIGLLLMFLGWKYEHTNPSMLNGFSAFVYKAYDLVFVNTRNGFCQGLAYIAAGMVISTWKLRNKLFAFFFVVLGGVMFIHDYPFSLLLLSIGLFILGSNIAVAFLENNITFCQTLRSMSILMYFFHMYVIAFMGLCLKKGWIMWNVYEVWGVVWLITILFAFFVCYYMQTESGKWIKRII